MAWRNGSRKEVKAELFPCYARHQMADYAESMRDLAYNYNKLIMTEPEEIINRREYFYRKQLEDNWKQLANRIRDASVLVEKIAKETYTYTPFRTPVERAIKRQLRMHHISMQKCFLIRCESGSRKYSLFLENEGHKMHTTQEVAAILSGVLHRSVTTGKNCPVFLGYQPEEFIFEEREHFYIMTGQARAIKEGEKYSGDNLSVTQTPEGKQVLMLSDGVGSGEQACKDSATLIDLAEKYYETGFGQKETLPALEGLLLGLSMENRMPTLDLCEIDLNQGSIEMLKMGSAPGLIVREDGIERVESKNLMLGYADLNSLNIEKRSLQGGEYLILMTDGAAEYVDQTVEIQLYKDVYHRRGFRNPGVLANRLLKHVIEAGEGAIKDDMTILIAGVFTNRMSSHN